MKKLMMVVIATIMFIPMMVMAKDDVSITEIKQLEITGKTEVVNEATVDGLKINVDVKFHDVGDSISYKLVVKNNSNKDYYLTNDKSLNSSSYISYKFSYPNDNELVKAGESKELTLTMKYNKEVPSDKLVNGVFTENNVVRLSLSDNPDNPKTFFTDYGLYLVGIILFGIVIFILIKRKSKKTFLLLFSILLVPVVTKAYNELRIEINSNVEINNQSEFCFKYYNGQFSEFDSTLDEYEYVEYFKYIDGMTWNEYSTSSLNTKFITEIQHKNSGYEYNGKYLIPDMFSTLYIDNFIEKLNKDDDYFERIILLSAIKNITGAEIVADDDKIDTYYDTLDEDIQNKIDDEFEKIYNNRFQDVDYSNKIKSKYEGCYYYYYLM